MNPGGFAGRRIVLISHWDYNLWRFRRELMEMLVGAGATVYAAVPSGNFDSRWSTIGVKHLPFAMNRASLHPRDAFGMIRQLRAIFHRVKPDLVHTFMVKPNIFGSIAARLAGVPVVVCSVTGRGSFFDGVLDSARDRAVGSLIRALYRVAGRLADRTIFLNPDDVDLFTSLGLVPPARATLIRSSGVNISQFRPSRLTDSEREAMRAELGIAPDHVAVLMVARMLRSKGVATYFEAARVLADRGAPVRFFYAGSPDSGSVESFSTEEASALAGAAHVLQLGHRNDIENLLAISDVYTLPTHAAEGVPRSVLEAMASGLPIITTDMPGCRETVRNGENGYIVRAGDAGALAAGIAELASDHALRQRMGKASRAMAVKEFAVDRVVEQHLALYQQLLGA